MRDLKKRKCALLKRDLFYLALSSLKRNSQIRDVLQESKKEVNY